jgi:hypothetical protein
LCRQIILAQRRSEVASRVKVWCAWGMMAQRRRQGGSLAKAEITAARPIPPAAGGAGSVERQPQSQGDR